MKKLCSAEEHGGYLDFNKKYGDQMVRPTQERQNQGRLNNFEIINKLEIY